MGWLSVLVHTSLLVCWVWGGIQVPSVDLERAFEHREKDVIVTNGDWVEIEVPKKASTGDGRAWDIAGRWHVIAGSGYFKDPSAKMAYVSELDIGKNTFVWVELSETCQAEVDILASDCRSLMVHVTRIQPSFAGDDQILYQGHEAVLSARTAPRTAAGIWRVMAGGANIQNTTSPKSVVKGLSMGQNVFRWVVMYGHADVWSETTLSLLEPELECVKASKNQPAPLPCPASSPCPKLAPTPSSCPSPTPSPSTTPPKDVVEAKKTPAGFHKGDNKDSDQTNGATKQSAHTATQTEAAFSGNATVHTQSTAEIVWYPFSWLMVLLVVLVLVVMRFWPAKGPLEVMPEAGGTQTEASAEDAQQDEPRGQDQGMTESRRDDPAPAATGNVPAATGNVPAEEIATVLACKVTRGATKPTIQESPNVSKENMDVSMHSTPSRVSRPLISPDKPPLGTPRPQVLSPRSPLGCLTNRKSSSKGSPMNASKGTPLSPMATSPTLRGLKAPKCSTMNASKGSPLEGGKGKITKGPMSPVMSPTPRSCCKSPKPPKGSTSALSPQGVAPTGDKSYASLGFDISIDSTLMNPNATGDNTELENASFKTFSTISSPSPKRTLQSVTSPGHPTHLDFSEDVHSTPAPTSGNSPSLMDISPITGEDEASLSRIDNSSFGAQDDVCADGEAKLPLLPIPTMQYDYELLTPRGLQGFIQTLKNQHQALVMENEELKGNQQGLIQEIEELEQIIQTMADGGMEHQVTPSTRFANATYFDRGLGLETPSSMSPTGIATSRGTTSPEQYQNLMSSARNKIKNILTSLHEKSMLQDSWSQSSKIGASQINDSFSFHLSPYSERTSERNISCRKSPEYALRTATDRSMFTSPQRNYLPGSKPGAQRVPSLDLQQLQRTSDPLRQDMASLHQKLGTLNPSPNHKLYNLLQALDSALAQP